MLLKIESVDIYIVLMLMDGSNYVCSLFSTQVRLVSFDFIIIAVVSSGVNSVYCWILSVPYFSFSDMGRYQTTTSKNQAILIFIHV